MSRKQTLPLSGMRADYEIAKQGGRFRRPRKGVSGVGTSADYHFRNESEWAYAIEYARDLDRNDCVAGMTIDRILDTVLQDSGIQPDPATGDENADELLKKLWNDWAGDESACDMAGEMTFTEIERQILRSTLVDGDIFPIGNENGSLELLESHRCRTPSNSKRNIVLGVEMDERRSRMNYFFTKDDRDLRSMVKRVSDTVPIAARDEDGHRQVFHVFDPNRVSQTRGISVFRRVADALGMHDDIEFANLVRQQIASCFAIIKERSQGGPLSNPNYGETTTDGAKTIDNIGPGMELTTNPGEKMTGFSPNIPNPQYFQQAQKVLKTITANLGIPLQAVMLDASETNFSGWRGAMDQARSGFRRLQKWLIAKFHARVWRWKVRQWLSEYPQLATWAAQDGVDIFKVDWKRPTWEYIQPVQDTAADVAKVRGLITSLRRIHGNRGDDFDELMPEIINDNVAVFRMARDAARALNAEAEEDSERISWRELLAMPTHEGLNVQLLASADPGQFGGQDGSR